MNLYRWWRMRRALRRRSLIVKLRVANVNLQLSLRGLKASECYETTQKAELLSTNEWQFVVDVWSKEIQRLSRALGITQLQAAKYW